MIQKKLKAFNPDVFCLQVATAEKPNEGVSDYVGAKVVSQFLYPKFLSRCALLHNSNPLISSPFSM